MKYRSFSDLNPDQRLVVTHGSKAGSKNAKRALLVLAGAGSGKTKTLAYRVAYLVVERSDPNRILLLAFGRRAAQETTNRACDIVSKIKLKRASLPWAGTFHSIGLRL
jgi:DNA helicase-2/ATP-dependent DNA helicase PcrA